MPNINIFFTPTLLNIKGIAKINMASDICPNVILPAALSKPISFKKGLANGQASNQKEILNTTKVLTANSQLKMVTNFAPKTSSKEIRPITNFSFYNVTDPTPSEVNLKNFYHF